MQFLRFLVLQDYRHYQAVNSFRREDYEVQSLFLGFSYRCHVLRFRRFKYPRLYVRGYKQTIHSALTRSTKRRHDPARARRLALSARYHRLRRCRPNRKKRHRDHLLRKESRA